MKRRECACCLNDSTVKNITFDEGGVCNYCNSYRLIETRLKDYDRLEALFRKKIDRERGKHRYDVALGLSGGKDSSYVLYMLVKKYGLKVITYTLDNGFLSAEAREKIDSLVEFFQVEHEYVRCDMSLLKKTYHDVCKKYLSPCIVCSYLGYAMMMNYPSRVDAAIGIHGRSIPQMLRFYDPTVEDVFNDFVTEGLKDSPDLTAGDILSRALGNVSTLVDREIAQAIEEHLLPDVTKNGCRDFVAYFLYHAYDENEVVRTLEENTVWKVTKEREHFDCLIHHGATYLKNLIARRAHILPEVSVLVRSGQISRESGRAMLDVTVPAQAEAELKRFCEFSGLNYRSFIWKAKIYAKRWW